MAKTKDELLLEGIRNRDTQKVQEAFVQIVQDTQKWPDMEVFFKTDQGKKIIEEAFYELTVPNRKPEEFKAALECMQLVYKKIPQKYTGLDQSQQNGPKINAQTISGNLGDIGLTRDQINFINEDGVDGVDGKTSLALVDTNKSIHKSIPIGSWNDQKTRLDKLAEQKKLLPNIDTLRATKVKEKHDLEHTGCIKDLADELKKQGLNSPNVLNIKKAVSQLSVLNNQDKDFHNKSSAYKALFEQAHKNVLDAKTANERANAIKCLVELNKVFFTGVDRDNTLTIDQQRAVAEFVVLDNLNYNKEERQLAGIKNTKFGEKVFGADPKTIKINGLKQSLTDAIGQKDTKKIKGILDQITKDAERADKANIENSGSAVALDKDLAKNVITEEHLKKALENVAKAPDNESRDNAINSMQALWDNIPREQKNSLENTDFGKAIKSANQPFLNKNKQHSANLLFEYSNAKDSQDLDKKVHDVLKNAILSNDPKKLKSIFEGIEQDRKLLKKAGIIDENRGDPYTVKADMIDTALKNVLKACSVDQKNPSKNKESISKSVKVLEALFNKMSDEEKKKIQQQEKLDAIKGVIDDNNKWFGSSKKVAEHFGVGKINNLLNDKQIANVKYNYAEAFEAVSKLVAEKSGKNYDEFKNKPEFRKEVGEVLKNADILDKDGNFKKRLSELSDQERANLSNSIKETSKKLLEAKKWSCKIVPAICALITVALTIFVPPIGVAVGAWALPIIGGSGLLGYGVSKIQNKIVDKEIVSLTVTKDELNKSIVDLKGEKTKDIGQLREKEKEKVITSAIDLPEIKTAIQTAQGIGNGKQELNAQQKKEVTDKIIELEKKERQNDKSGKPKITDLERIQLKILKDDQKAVDQGGTNKISVGDAAKIALDSVQAHNKNNSKQMTR